MRFSLKRQKFLHYSLLFDLFCHICKIALIEITLKSEGYSKKYLMLMKKKETLEEGNNRFLTKSKCWWQFYPSRELGKRAIDPDEDSVELYY